MISRLLNKWKEYWKCDVLMSIGMLMICSPIFIWGVFGVTLWTTIGVFAGEFISMVLILYLTVKWERQNEK